MSALALFVTRLGPYVCAMRELALEEQFIAFAEVECRHEPIYRALCLCVARDRSLLALMDAASPTQRRPNLLLAAVHDRLLAGAGGALAAYFPTVGGARDPDEAVAAAFAAFVNANRAGLIEDLATRATQTNEVGRCAVLWPTLQWLARHAGHERRSLVDVGCSAGLNLGVDEYAFDDGSTVYGLANSPVRVRTSWRGARRPSLDGSLDIVRRVGLDIAPISARDEAGARWLKACIWPHASERHARFDAAVSIARTRARDVRAVSDCAVAAREIFDESRGEGAPVFFNSWVLSYFTRPQLERYIAVMEALVSEGAAWISAEPPGLVRSLPGASSLSELEAREATEWIVLTRERVARSHPHGAWIEWCADEP